MLPDEIERLKAIIEHARGSCRNPWNEPEYVEAVYRLRELEGAERLPPPIPEAFVVHDLRRIIEGHEAVNLGLVAQIATLTAQRDAAVALLRESVDFLDDGITPEYWSDGYRAFREKLEAIALCSPAPPAEPTRQEEAQLTATIYPSWPATPNEA